ncbi:MAG: hypothetical protein EBU70_01545, partial [Actinobacteria bacterium]|nr:hypothetical protein [Actinomycetota bacterium]
MQPARACRDRRSPSPQPRWRRYKPRGRPPPTHRSRPAGHARTGVARRDQTWRGFRGPFGPCAGRSDGSARPTASQSRYRVGVPDRSRIAATIEGGAAAPFRRTRIVATIGPASDSPAVLDALIGAGADVFRISASHDPVDVVRARVAAVRAAAARTGAEVAVMVDLCGPKLRCIPPADAVELVEGETWRIVSGPADGSDHTLGSTVPADAWARIPSGTVLA